jgi:hypothetical protein
MTPSVRSEFVRALDPALRKTAAALERQGGRTIEADLERELVAALSGCANGWDVSAQHPITMDGWRKARPVDVAITFRDAPPVLIELKCGKGTLYNCAWDAVKLALALAEGRTRGLAYLIAAAPTSDWQGEVEGSEIFTLGEDWRAEEFLERYAKHFDFWRVDVPTTGPRRLPERFHTFEFEEIEGFEVEGQPWEIHTGAVTLTVECGWVDIDSDGRVSAAPESLPGPRLQLDEGTRFRKSG